MRQILSILNRYKGFIIGVAVVAALAVAALQIGHDLEVAPDKDYLEAQTKKTTDSVIKIDSSIINAVRKQINISGQPDLSNLGKSDPFSP